MKLTLLALLLALNCPALSVEQRTRLQFDALQPKKGANQAYWPATASQAEKPVKAAPVKRVVTMADINPMLAAPPAEVEIPWEVYVPMNATFTFEVVGQPRSYGLWRSFDGGTNKIVWVKWVNDLLAKDFPKSVTLMCDGPTNRLIQVGTWASNSW